MNTPAAQILNGLATGISGYGVVIEGILNPDTIGQTPNAAAAKAILLMFGPLVMLAVGCNDPDCDCKVRHLAELKPDTKVVPVSIQVAA